jgi:hypothetical protein
MDQKGRVFYKKKAHVKKLNEQTNKRKKRKYDRTENGEKNKMKIMR